MTILNAIIGAFAGGVFGALFGGTTLFIFMGFMVLLGSAIALAGGGDVFLTQVAFGTSFAPHIAFVGGVGAAAFYGRHRMTLSHDEEFAKSIAGFTGADTVTPLMKMKDIPTLIVGGLFGVLGLGLVTGLTMLESPVDASASTVALTGIIARLLFGKSGMTGKFAPGEKRYDLSANHLIFTALWTASLAFVTYQVVSLTQVNVLMFGFSGLSLIVLYFGLPIPVTHHITLVTGTAALMFGNMWIAVLFGVFAGFLGNFFQRSFNTNVDSHVDNAALTIAVCTLLMSVTQMI